MLFQNVIVHPSDQQIEEQVVIVEKNVRQRHAPRRKHVYNDAFLAEWILISNYSAEDFGHRFIWPELEPEVGRHFLGAAA